MITLEINGQNYKVEYDINAGCDMEDRSGKIITRLIDDSLTAVRLMLWGGLRLHHEDITLTDAGRLVSAHGDRITLMQTLLDEMVAAGFFGKAAQKPPESKRISKASGKSTQP